MTEQVKVPEIRFAGFTDPWEQRKLGDVADLLTGYPFESRHFTDTGIPLVRGMNVKRGYLDMSADICENWSDAVGVEDYLLKAGDIVIQMDGALIGSSYAMVTPENTPSLLVQRVTRVRCGNRSRYIFQAVQRGFLRYIKSLKTETAVPHLSLSDIADYAIPVPKEEREQEHIGSFFSRLDDLITLHQRKRESRIIRVRSFIWLAGDISGIGVSAYQPEREDRMTEGNTNAETLFCDYYEQWISVYKEGAIREVTMKKYRLTQAWLGRLIPDLKLADMDRVNYQKLINGYAEHHERQTTMDFHHQLKGAILDAVDEGLIQRDPTRKAIIKGKPPCSKKTKYLNQFELHAVLADLELGKGPSWDWLILLVVKTGLRFSEALGLTPDDFDFVHQTLSVSKTWDYKNGGGFVPTKNASSVRKVQLDWQLIMQLSTLLKDLPAGDPIFVNGKVYNSTANNILARHCERANVPVISIHGLRHTHASLLLFAGVSIASVSKRLGHASMNTTQDTYLHVIRELENKDVDIVMRALSTLI